MVNKFLYPKGGAETYVFQLGAELTRQGHEVQYFGMEDEKRIVGNNINAYTSKVEFHGGGLEKLTYPFRIINSKEARKKIRLVLDDFAPDVVHLNNFNYQLTPSIILEVRKWEKDTGKKVKIVYTAHDYQLVCPNHMMRNVITNENCEKCVGGNFFNCVKGKCIHGSFLKSVVGWLEASYWNNKGVYKEIDTLICCSQFMKEKLDSNPIFKDKTITLHNFIDGGEAVVDGKVEKKDYVLYFGRYSKEKGIETLIKACKNLPEISFIFAGSGPLEDEIDGVANVQNVGFQTGEALTKLICEARFSVCPSEWYENCPFSVLESLTYATPVLGAKIGGIPELVEEGVTGELFESGNVEALQEKIATLWRDEEKLERYTENCKAIRFDTVEEYCKKILELYKNNLNS